MADVIPSSPEQWAQTWEELREQHLADAATHDAIAAEFRKQAVLQDTHARIKREQAATITERHLDKKG